MNELTDRFGQCYEVHEYEHDRLYVTLWTTQFKYVNGCTWTFRMRYYDWVMYNASA